ncbi:NAD(P)/FAD-dependent oxidoreductase [Desulfobulbus marinus]|nr:FAD-dependent oxidoreductase [Desulfogranum marinum]MBM9512257.1 NAD(P)/FAD-dependent oxidoreductase [Desulfogranum marinum]
MLDYTAKVYLIANELDVTQELESKLHSSDVDHIADGIEAIVGEHAVESMRLENGQTIETEGVFIELGSKGALDLAAQIGVQLDTESFKYIETNKKQETSITGIYAAGDMVGPPYQMAKAVGEGCVAGMEATTHARSLILQLERV